MTDKILAGDAVSFHHEDDGIRRYGIIEKVTHRQGGFFNVFHIKETTGRMFQICEMDGTPERNKNVRLESNSILYILTN